jgi:mono/diheme cytochrome c family protein
MKAVVRVVQAVAALAAVAFVALLFLNEPDDADVQATPTGAEVDGASVFADRCAGCHGPDGGGRSGPQLSEGSVVEAFPDIEDQIDVVTDGRGGMPSFGSRLSPEEIRAVVEYSRTL